MKKVLMIAHQFPPIGGSGVQRTVKFVKYLRGFGYEPVVLTRSAEKATLKDETLLSDIPEGIEVIRTKSCDFAEWPSIFSYGGKIIKRLLIPDGERVWAMNAKKQAVEYLKNNHIDAIYTTSAPYSDHLLGLYLKKKFPQIPLICDFRDEWTNNPYHVRKGYRARLERKEEMAVLAAADQLITNTPVMLANFLRDNPDTKNKFSVIPNGYDQEDFTEIKDIIPKNSVFTLTYTGLLYGRRKPDNFFAALKAAVESGHIDRKNIKVQLIGNYKKEALQATIDSYGVSDMVVLLPYMKHKDSLKELMKSDALLLIEPSGPGAEAFYTGKVFEYMNTRRPILATIPGKGAAAQLVSNTGTGLVSDYDDIKTTKENLVKLFRGWKEGKTILTPDYEQVLKFERRELTKELASILDKAINNRI